MTGRRALTADCATDIAVLLALRDSLCQCTAPRMRRRVCRKLIIESVDKSLMTRAADYARGNKDADACTDAAHAMPTSQNVLATMFILSASYYDSPLNVGLMAGFPPTRRHWFASYFFTIALLL